MNMTTEVKLLTPQGNRWQQNKATSQTDSGSEGTVNRRHVATENKPNFREVS